MSERAVNSGNIITVVSGMPRSGTSMMMQMLEAVGLEIDTDGERAPDDDNPNGYFELEAAKRLKKDTSFLEKSVGKVVKIVAPLLRDLPSEYDYRLIFMERDMDEVIASQRVMMDRGDSIGAGGAEDSALVHALRKQVRSLEKWLDDSPNFRVCHVSHRLVIESRSESCDRIVKFLQETGAFGTNAKRGEETLSACMADVVESRLYRQRSL